MTSLSLEFVPALAGLPDYALVSQRRKVLVQRRTNRSSESHRLRPRHYRRKRQDWSALWLMHIKVRSIHSCFHSMVMVFQREKMNRWFLTTNRHSNGC